MTFGQRLSGLLEEHELTQKQFADLMHLAESTLSGYVNGHREPDYKTLAEIATYFKVSTDYLLGVTNVPTSLALPLNEQEGDLIGTYRNLQTGMQDLLREQAHLYRRHDLRKRKEVG